MVVIIILIQYLLILVQKPIEPPPPPPAEKPWAEEDTAVRHLDAATFRSALRKVKHAIVMFYAPCKCIYYPRVNFVPVAHTAITSAVHTATVARPRPLRR